MERIGVGRAKGTRRVIATPQDDVDMPGAVLADGGNLCDAYVGQTLRAELALAGLEREVVATGGRVVLGRAGVLGEAWRRVSQRIVRGVGARVVGVDVVR